MFVVQIKIFGNILKNYNISIRVIIDFGHKKTSTSPSFFVPSLSQPPIALRTLGPSPTIQSAPTSLTIPPISKPSLQMTNSSSSTGSSSSSSGSSYTALLINQNPHTSSTILPTQQLQNSYQNATVNTNQSATPTTILLERSPLNVSRVPNPQHSQRRSLSQSLSASVTSVNILPTSTNPQVTSTLLNNYRTPTDEIEDQLLIDCCCFGTMRADRRKTLSAFLLALCTLYFCSFIITIVDERLPDPKKFPPLPDLVLDNVKQIPWAFAVTEKIIVIEMATLISILVLHRHRLIIIRRLFAIAAALYFLRSLTMVFTSLPVATEKTDCRPEKLISFAARLKKATLIFVGQGMSSFGVKTCGDYLYSGHTCTLVLATHFINEYSPRSYRLLHFLSWIMAITGMLCILASHQHYSIDILIAWVLSSRLFIYYHTLANNRTYFQRDKNRMRIWFPFFTYFEENVKQAIPNEYCLPTFIGEARTKMHGCMDRLRYPSD